MSDPIFSKLSELLGAIIKPNHLMIVITVVSGVILFDIYKIRTVFDIQEEAQLYKFWIALAFFLFGGLQLIGLISFSASWVSRHFVRVYRNVTASRIALSDDAVAILVLMTVRKPDSTRLMTQHPAVRELRLNDLITSNAYVITGGEFDHYTLTEQGMASVLPRLETFPRQPDQLTRDMIRTVTGAD